MKIQKYIDNISRDKLLHIVACAAFAALVKTALRCCGCPLWASALVAFALAMTIGVVKERRDSRFDWHDIVADAIGAAIGAM